MGGNDVEKPPVPDAILWVRCNAAGALYFTLLGIAGVGYMFMGSGGEVDAAMVGVLAVLFVPFLLLAALHGIGVWAPRKKWVGIWVVIQHMLLLLSCYWSLPAIVGLVALTKPAAKAWFTGEALPEPSGRSTTGWLVAALIVMYWFVTVTGSFAVAMTKLMSGPADDLEQGGVERLVIDPYGAQHYSTPVEEPAALAATYIDGTPWTLDASLQRPMGVLVWASWCPTCDDDMQRVGRSELASRTGLYLLALDCELEGRDNREAVRADVERAGLDWPVLCSDGEGALVERVEQLPTVLVLDRDRRLRYVGDGHASPDPIARVMDELEAR